MYNNPYQIFGIDEDMTPYDLRGILLQYKADAMKLNYTYKAYFSQVGPIAMRTKKRSEIVEELLSKRYEFGMDFNQIPLGEDEIGDFLRRVIQHRSQTAVEEGMPTITKEDVDRRIEMYIMSSLLTSEMQIKIEKAIKAFDENPQDDSQMMDVLISIRYGELKSNIAKELAKRVSNNGLIINGNEFKNLMLEFSSYEQLKKIYEQIATKDKRDELIPEMYINKNMSDMSGITVIDEDTVNYLIHKEHRYTSEYFEDMATRFDGSKDRNEPSLYNRNHDYAWGMILEKPRAIINDEIVNTPIFQGRIKVERIGLFTEKSLFARSKYARETDIKKEKEIKHLKSGPLARLTMKHRDEKDSTVPKTMREQFYLHETKKTMFDNIWKVTKTDKDGKIATYIIFTPLEYLGNRGSELFEFIKNIYLSDYMLDIAMQNGGYAGRVHKDASGYSISTRYNQEEIASAVLFRHGQRGSIHDCRVVGRKVMHSNQTVDDFMNLINSKNRGERVKDE